MGFPKTYESRYKTELHQLLVNYGENKWIWYKISRASEHNGLRIRTDKDFPGREDMFNNIGNVLSLVHHEGSMSDPDDYQFISNENVTKNHVNDLLAEIEQYSKKYIAQVTDRHQSVPLGETLVIEQLETKIKYDLRRLALVDAIISSSECPGISFCTAPDCCLDLGRLSKICGLRTIKHFDQDDELQSDRCLEYRNPLLVSETAARALAILDFQHQVKRYSAEYTAYELLIEVKPDAPVYLQEFFNEQFGIFNPDLSRSRQLALKRQIGFCLISIALPDLYLDHYDSQEQS
jgi:hypothetical protein